VPQNDVISCLSHFIFRHWDDLEQSGQSGGQITAQDRTKITVIWFFQDLICRGIYFRIDLEFLVVGHTYGPTDRTFGVIENYTLDLSQCTLLSSGLQKFHNRPTW